jgi:predicted transcriptional regulator
VVGLQLAVEVRMKQLSCMLADELMEGLDVLVSASKASFQNLDRSYFVRQAIQEYLKRELPNVAKQKKDEDLRDLLKTAQRSEE